MGWDAAERELLRVVLQARNLLLEQHADEDALELRARIRAMIGQECERYQRRAITTNQVPALTDPAATEQKLRDYLLGLGVLEELMRRPDIQTIFVNGPADVRVLRDGSMERLVGIRFPGDRDVRELVKRAASAVGREFDSAHPSVDVALPDGSRLHANMPPVTEEFTQVTIRRFTLFNRRLPYFVEQGTLSAACATFLSASVRGRANILVAGDTGAGKTSLVRAMALEIDDPQCRMITIEDPRELGLSKLLDGCLAWEARPPNSEGKGEITTNQLLERDALRSEPTRIVVGECRGIEAYTFLKALDTGHRGSFTTIHARSAKDALDRLLTNAMEAPHGPDRDVLLRRIASNIDLVVFLEKRPEGRRVTEVIEVEPIVENGAVSCQPLFAYRAGRLASVAARRPRVLEQIEAAGIACGWEAISA